MSSAPNHHSSATQTGFDALILEFTRDLRRQGISELSIAKHHPGPARHFLTWLERTGIAVKTVDGEVIDRFLRHDCDCCSAEWVSNFVNPWRKRERDPKLMRFVRFLERTGRIETPGDLDDNLSLIDGFAERMLREGYRPQAIRRYKTGCTGLIVWLHFTRIRLRDLNPNAYAQFRNRDVNYSVPGLYWGRRIHSPGQEFDVGIRMFLCHLVEIGHIAPLDPAPETTARPARLNEFSFWLERYRGIRSATKDQYTRAIAAVLPALGDNPRNYDAALIRQVLLDHIQDRSQSYAGNLATSLRMYLRFLASEGCIEATLVEAVPKIPRWRLSALPRYISTDYVERSIASCG